MIFLEVPFFRHYVFVVVQTSSSPTHPGGNPPSIMVRAREAETGERADTDAPCPLNITTGTVALLLNRMPSHPPEQQPI